MTQPRSTPPGRPTPPGRAADLLAAAAAARPAADARRHRPAAPGDTLTKWLLPIAALALLSSIALWPEFDRAKEQARLAFNRLGGEVDGAQVTDARYHGVDERSRPYTITATTAVQVGSGPGQPHRSRRATSTLENGTWMMLQAKQGRVHAARRTSSTCRDACSSIAMTARPCARQTRHDRPQERRRGQRRPGPCRRPVRRRWTRVASP